MIVTHEFYEESSTPDGQKYTLQKYDDFATVRLILGESS